ncbi:hypothetical protein [Lysobacter hankyongensis]|uniref:Uncharacterized protein n=1 Tax=Lysobacter hankyongensis TaxID=1176535 RepID=A0ABP9BIC0_9GAMM
MAALSNSRRHLTLAVGWTYLAIGAMCMAGMLSSQGMDGVRPSRDWEPAGLVFVALLAFSFSFAGYRVLRHPPQHRRRTLLLGFVVLVCVWFAWASFRRSF